MNANSFNKIKIFSYCSAKSLEDAVNKFLKENYGKIKVVKRSINSVSWGKHQSWDPVIQIILSYKEQKQSYGERVAIIRYEQSDAYKTEESCNKQMVSNNIEAIDLLSTSYIGNFQYSYVSSFVAIFMKA